MKPTISHMFYSDAILASISFHKSGASGWHKICGYMIHSPGRMMQITAIYDSKRKLYYSKDRAFVPMYQVYESEDRVIVPKY